MNTKTSNGGIFFIVIGAVSVAEGLRFYIKQDPNIPQQMLQPGVYIFMLGLVLLIVGVVHLIDNYRQPIGMEKVTVSKKMRIRVVSIVAVLSVYAFLIHIVGYLAASIPFYLLIFKILEVRSWQSNIILSLSLAITYYIIFVQFCNVVFPRGILFS